MAGFLYYMPKGRESEIEEIIHGRLGPGLAIGRRPQDIGPDKQGGMLFWLQAAEAKARAYHADRQHWTDLAGRFWIGAEKDSPPGPNDLVRVDSLGGHPVRLGDDQEWLIPVARVVFQAEDGSLGFSPGLPQRVGLSPDGSLGFQSLPKYSWFTDQAEKIWRLLVSAEGEKIEFSWEDSWKIAVEALRMNYLMAAEEVSLLGLITTKNAFALMRAVVDWPGVEQVVQALAVAQTKKARAATGDTSVTDFGGTDYGPGIGPQ